MNHKVDPVLPALLTAVEMREWESRSFEAGGGVSERVVLESAGRAIALAVAHAFPEGRVIGAVGRGNNGGDALVALRTLRALGREVVAVEIGDAVASRELLHGWEIPICRLGEGEVFRNAGVLLDGILGTGASGPPREPQLAAIRSMNASGIPILAIDGPTGVDLSDGGVETEAIEASVTVTFGAIKRGLILHPGRRHAGRILLAEVGFPPADHEQAASRLITDDWAAARLPAIPPDAHKGTLGIVAVVAGRRGFAGAAIMATMGALRAGSGGVRLVSAEDNRALLQTAIPEAIFHDREAPDLGDLIGGVSAILIGPGLGTDDESAALLRRVLALELPMVLDADALTLLAREPFLVIPAKAGIQRQPEDPRSLARDTTRPHARRATRSRAGGMILTPHPGELGRLLGRSTESVLSDRFAAVTEAADRFGCVVLSKGAPSLVAVPGHPTLVGTAGHSGVATGGMGDTLAGVVTALVGMGCTAREAAAVGLHFAGRAAEIAGRGRGLLPRDVAEALPAALRGEGAKVPPNPPFLLQLDRST